MGYCSHASTFKRVRPPERSSFKCPSFMRDQAFPVRRWGILFLTDSKREKRSQFERLEERMIVWCWMTIVWWKTLFFATSHLGNIKEFSSRSWQCRVWVETVIPCLILTYAWMVAVIHAVLLSFQKAFSLFYQAMNDRRRWTETESNWVWKHEPMFISIRFCDSRNNKDLEGDLALSNPSTTSHPHK